MATAVIVDDNRNSCHLLARLLQHEGHAAVCTYRGDEALEAAKRYKPDLLILDVRLPDMNGVEVLRRMRQDPGLQQTAVVLISGVDDLSVQTEAFRYGAMDYILKGLEWDQLMHRIEPYLPRR